MVGAGSAEVQQEQQWWLSCLELSTELLWGA